MFYALDELVVDCVLSMSLPSMERREHRQDKMLLHSL